jgi:2-keto-4-pentenoate hydratase/2-oxohepta-3-ene-1,7-dioic acid hydratase in catechol pathway
LRPAPVVVAPEKIICVGLNYRRHAVEANMPIPTTPVIFGKFANSLSASGDCVGREARDVSVARALGYVAG